MTGFRRRKMHARESAQSTRRGAGNRREFQVKFRHLITGDFRRVADPTSYVSSLNPTRQLPLRTELDIDDAFGDLAEVLPIRPDIRGQGDARLGTVPVLRDGYREWRRAILAGRNGQIQ